MIGYSQLEQIVKERDDLQKELNEVSLQRREAEQNSKKNEKLNQSLQ